jgi:hypothetical protein
MFYCRVNGGEHEKQKHHEVKFFKHVGLTNKLTNCSPAPGNHFIVWIFSSHQPVDDFSILSKLIDEINSNAFIK